MSDVLAVRSDLRETGWYLGRAEGVEDVLWKRIGNENRLVTVDAAAEYEDALALATNVDADHADAVIDEPTVEGVALSLITKISPSDFWLTPCGYWKGPTTYTPKFADLKLSCRLITPEEPTLAADFNAAQKNLLSLMKKIEMQGYNSKVGVLDLSKAGIKLRHVVFEEKRAGNEDEDDFKMCEWPAKSEAAKAARDEMDTSHRVHRIPAYDVGGDLIPPDRYASLSGAVVRATITLTHWAIGASKRDSYAADIVSFRVLVPGAPGGGSGKPSSPRKRRIEDRDPGASPMKKMREN
ncbi:hypothetical protein B0H10DRAFT_1937705 [Mycena sp. CBHHK59/15]|nr:hypothetical protein B0H10DRAFT_1937705 [Mycena sp. CBHHK59/15]